MLLVCNEGVPLREIAKGTKWLLYIFFHVLVAERINFDVYAGIAVHGFLIAANS